MNAKKPSKTKSVSINARCTPDRHAAYRRLAAQLGYPNFSEFLLVLLDGMLEDFDGHESRLLHVSGNQILASGPAPIAIGGGSSSAFPVIGPSRFWRHVERNTG